MLKFYFILFFFSLCLSCQEGALKKEFRERNSENAKLIQAFERAIKCKTLHCTLRTEKRLQKLEQRVVQQRRKRASQVKGCDFGDAASGFGDRSELFHDCFESRRKELKIRRREHAEVSTLLGVARHCASLECTRKAEREVEKKRQEIHKARRQRWKKCVLSATDRLAVPSGANITHSCVLKSEGICVDFAPDLSAADSRSACAILTDSYDEAGTAFFAKYQCNKASSIGSCSGANSMLEQGKIVFFSPMTVAMAKRHCTNAGGRFHIASIFTRVSIAGRQTAEDLAFDELESYKSFVSLLEGSLMPRNASSFRSLANSTEQRSGSQRLRVIGAIILLVFIILFAVVATMLYVKTMVEGQHRRRKVGEGYVKVSSDDAEVVVQNDEASNNSNNSNNDLK